MYNIILYYFKSYLYVKLFSSSFLGPNYYYYYYYNVARHLKLNFFDVFELLHVVGTQNIMIY